MQQLNMDDTEYEEVLNPKDDTNIKLREDLTGFTEVRNGKKKSPAKTQPKTIVDSPRTPRTSHHQPQRLIGPHGTKNKTNSQVCDAIQEVRLRTRFNNIRIIRRCRRKGIR